MAKIDDGEELWIDDDGGDRPPAKREWITGYLLMWSRKFTGLLIQFSDMDGPCWVPASQVPIVLDEPGWYGPGVFGVPEWLVETRLSVCDAAQAARDAAADRAEAEERERAAAAAEREREKASRRRPHSPSGQMGLDL
jgi:hypothetical protein